MSSDINFPEYSISLQKLGIDPNRPPEMNETIIESAENAYSRFVNLRNRMQTLGFPDNKSDFGFTFEPHSTLYKSLIFDNYLKNQLKEYNPQILNGMSYPSMSLLGLSQLRFSIVSANLNPLFESQHGNNSSSNKGAPRSIEEAVTNLSQLKIRNETLLIANGIEVSINNVLNLWLLERFSTLGMSCRATSYTQEEKAKDDVKFEERILSLMRYPIPLVDCFTALSWYGNPAYAIDGKFTHSPESIMEIQGIPQSFKDYYFFGDINQIRKIN